MYILPSPTCCVGTDVKCWSINISLILFNRPVVVEILAVVAQHGHKGLRLAVPAANKEVRPPLDEVIHVILIVGALVPIWEGICRPCQVGHLQRVAEI